MTRSTMLMAVLAIGVLVPRAQAGSPHINFSFGAVHGYHGHGWHHDCHPWPRSFVYSYAPRPVYVYPAPVVQPVYVAPGYSAAPAPATPNWTSRTEPRSNMLPASQSVTSAVTIRNPAGSGGNVAFVVDDASEVSLNAGQTQTLANKNSYTVEFDRGGDFGVARKTLSGGAYEFQVTDRGWDLVDAARVATKPSLRRNDLPSSQLR